MEQPGVVEAVSKWKNHYNNAISLNQIEDLDYDYIALTYSEYLSGVVKYLSSKHSSYDAALSREYFELFWKTIQKEES